MRKLILLPVLAAALAVAACNTVSGVGRDLEAAGEAIRQTANDVKN